MFTDIAGYTALMQEDEARARRNRDRHRTVVERQVDRHGGRVHQYYGDGTLSLFDSAIEAAASAVAIQRELSQAQVPVRIGIHTGDVVYDEEGVFGDGVNVASRIQGLGTPGSVLVSAKVHDELKNQPQLRCVSLGTFELKNVRQPIEVFAMDAEGLTLPAPDTLEAPRREMRRSVAVLPFTNMSADPENEYFSDGITEELINLLTRVNGLQVTARTSTFAFKNRQDDVRQIARQLGVQTVLEGSVRKYGQRIRVTAQLIDASNGYHLFSQTYDRRLADMFELQDEIAGAIMAAVQDRLGAEPAASLATQRSDTRAHALYLRGIHEFHRWTPESARSAIGIFEQATAIDPAYARAWAALAEAHAYLAYMGQADYAPAWRAAEQAALRALELDPLLGEAHLSLGLIKLFYYWDFDDAYNRVQKALSRNPGLAAAHHAFGVYLSIIGEPERALEELEAASRLDPLSLPHMMSLCWAFLDANRAQDALGAANRMLAQDPMFRAAYEGKGIALFALGRSEEALAVLHRVVDITGDAYKGLSPRGYILARTGRTDEARRILQMIQERERRHPELSLQIDYAILYGALGEVDRALEFLEEAARRRLGDVLFLVNSRIWLDLQHEPAFWTFLDRHGLSRIARARPAAAQ